MADSPGGCWGHREPPRLPRPRAHLAADGPGDEELQRLPLQLRQAGVAVLAPDAAVRARRGATAAAGARRAGAEARRAAQGAGGAGANAGRGGSRRAGEGARRRGAGAGGRGAGGAQGRASSLRRRATARPGLLVRLPVPALWGEGGGGLGGGAGVGHLEREKEQRVSQGGPAAPASFARTRRARGGPRAAPAPSRRRRRPAPRKLRGAGGRSPAAAGREAQEPRHRGDHRSEPPRQLTPYFLLRAVTAILSLFPATEFMVASQGSGRISYRIPSPHPKGTAGPGKSPAEQGGLLPAPPRTGSLSPKTPVSSRENAWGWGSLPVGFSSLSPLSFPYNPCFHRNIHIQIRSDPPDRQHSSHPQVR